MAEKTITGDLNVTGAYKQNGETLASGTKWYKHTISITPTDEDIKAEGDFVIISTSNAQLDLNAIDVITGTGRIPSYIGSGIAMIVSAPTIFDSSYTDQYEYRGLTYTNQLGRMWYITHTSAAYAVRLEAPTANLTTGAITRTETMNTISETVVDVVTEL